MVDFLRKIEKKEKFCRQIGINLLYTLYINPIFCWFQNRFNFGCFFQTEFELYS